MEIFLDEKYNKTILKTTNNIVFLYGQNTLGKTYFLHSLKGLITRKQNNVFSDLSFDDFRVVVEITENWDLKKELSLSKTSSIRKSLLGHVLAKLEEDEIDLLDQFNTNESLGVIRNQIDKNIQVKENLYFIKSDFSFKTDSDIIDKLFKLNLFDGNENEINENTVPISIKSKLYIKLLIESNSKNKIILFDCPETYLDRGNQIDFIDLINQLSKDNLLIITIRDPKFFSNPNIKISGMYYFEKNLLIKKIKFSNSLLLKTYFLVNKNFNSFNFKSLNEYKNTVTQAEFTLSKDDYSIMRENMYKHYVPLFYEYANFQKNEINIDELFFLTENEKMIIFLITLANELEYIFDFDKITNQFLRELVEYLK